MQNVSSTRPYLGAILGRVSNRVKNAQFMLNGETYHLPKNDGNNTLHGECLAALLFQFCIYVAKQRAL